MGGKESDTTEQLHFLVFLPGEFHGERSLDPWTELQPVGHKKLDMTEQLNTQAHWMGQAWPTRLRSVALGT